MRDMRISTGPVTWMQAIITLAVLGATLWLGLEKILASEAVAAIYTGALGYVYTAGVQERSARQATDTATEITKPVAEAATRAAHSADAAATSAAESAASATSMEP